MGRVRNRVARQRAPIGVGKARTLFVMPLLPKPHYLAVKALRVALDANTLETVCVALAVLAEEWNREPERVRARLEVFRTTAPLDTPPLIRDS